ncbi:putative carbon-nitrogen hydrolase [Lyophyllum shimeji]|uniref:Carbon-nitrogen hydrolase n=1 Tax=Lyophyllum shimeji TaxID=47721 RepID=A0A9P3PN10_LYOSH|nr:putative carbon-nitrogen hydrolase [Lyophyllum shimeji]
MDGGNPNVASPAQQGPPHIPLRVAVVQFNPKNGQVDENIAKARDLCLRLQPHSIDLLCFPEMAFTGYVFDSAEAISPYLEEPKTGPSSLFCREIAKHLGCYVAAGYPERLPEEERVPLEPEPEPSTDTVAGGMEIPPADGSLAAPQGLSSVRSTTASEPRIPVGANSAVIFGPSGEWVGGYRKTNLFETDKTWAKPGTGFTSFSLPLWTASPLPGSAEGAPPPQTLKVTLGICMDLNPHPPALWTSAEGPYELADYCMETQSKLLVLLDAWLYSGLTEDGEAAGDEKEMKDEKDQADEEAEETDDEDEPDWYTLRYWTARLRPLWRYDGRRRGSNETVVSASVDSSEGDRPQEEAVEEEEEEAKPPHETIVVVCNRTGKENGKTFAGSSAIFSMRAGSGRPKLLDMMGRREEGVRVWNLLV